MLLNLLITLALLGQSPVGAAQVAFEAGDYARVVKTLTAAQDMTPQDASVEYWLARAYYEQRDYDKAIAHAEEAVKLDGSNADYYRWLGRAYGAKAEESHSFFLARKVKQAFEAAVKLAPRSVPARRDLMQYLVEAPWIVGGDKDGARKQVDSIANIDPIEGRLARAAYLTAEKKTDEAAAEYLALIEQHPARIEAYVEAAEFFAARRDVSALDHVLSSAAHLNSADPRLEFYRAVVLVLRRKDLPKAESILLAYISNVPQRSDYPSHNQALRWLSAARS